MSDSGYRARTNATPCFVDSSSNATLVEIAYARRGNLISRIRCCTVSSKNKCSHRRAKRCLIAKSRRELRCGLLISNLGGKVTGPQRLAILGAWGCVYRDSFPRRRCVRYVAEAKCGNWRGNGLQRRPFKLCMYVEWRTAINDFENPLFPSSCCRRTCLVGCDLG